MNAREQAQRNAAMRLAPSFEGIAVTIADAASDVILSLSRRFMAKVAVSSDGCWEWTGTRRPGGYGQISLGGHQGKLKGAHVVSYELFVGDIGRGMHVCHHCDNPGCVRPDHLFLGTRSDNMQDASRKGRFASRRRTQGEANGRAKLTSADVAAIRDDLATPTSDLAAQYDVHRSTIQRVRNGSYWRNGVKTCAREALGEDQT